MKTYFVKEYTTDFGRSVAVGFVDTDTPTKLGDYLARMIVFECDTDTARAMRENDLISREELQDLAKITAVQYQEIEQAFAQALQAISQTANKCTRLNITPRNDE